MTAPVVETQAPPVAPQPVEPQVEGQAPVEPQVAPVEGKKEKRGTPTYAVEAVDGLPEQKRGTLNVRDRKTIYVPLLGDVAASPGQWFAIATYTSLTGARSAAKAITEDIQLAVDEPTNPAGIPVQGGAFEFETRRRVHGDNDSVLYARFMVAE